MSSNLDIYPTVVVSPPQYRAGIKRTHDHSTGLNYQGPPFPTALQQQQDSYSTQTYLINDLLVPAISPAITKSNKVPKFSCIFTAEELSETSPLSLSDTSSCCMEMDASPNNTYSSSHGFTAKVGGPGSTVGDGLLSTEEKTLQKEQSQCGFTLFITDEPEENYRARYESEGCRGPMKGRNGGCPSVMLTCHQRGPPILSATVSVELTNGDGTQLQSCRLDSTDDGQNLLKALQFSEKTQFDNLRIRRLKKTDAPTKGAVPMTTKKVGGRGKQDEKQAHLLFIAKIKIDQQQPPVVLKAISQAIYLNANHDPPDIHRVVPQYGAPGDPIAIIGTRMHSPRVTFIYTDTQTGREVEVNADYEKEISHQNALVVKVPLLPASAFPTNNPLVLSTYIKVTAGKGDRTGREPLRSHPSPFTYIKQGTCKECSFKQSIPATPPNAPPYAAIYQPPPPPPPYIRLQQTPPISSPPTMIMATPSISQTPPNSAPPIQSNHGEVDQLLLNELCAEDTSSVISPHGSPYTPYASPIHVRYPPQPTLLNQPVTMSSLGGAGNTKLEELDCYLPSSHSSPPPFSSSSSNSVTYHQSSSPSMMVPRHYITTCNNYASTCSSSTNNVQNP